MKNIETDHVCRTVLYFKIGMHSTLISECLITDKEEHELEGGMCVTTWNIYIYGWIVTVLFIHALYT